MTQDDIDKAAAEYVEEWGILVPAIVSGDRWRHRKRQWWEHQRCHAKRRLCKALGIPWYMYIVWAWRIKKAVDWIIEQLKQREAEAIAASEQR